MKKNYYIIILILYSEDKGIYKYNKLIWQEYMNSNDSILCLFIKYDNSISTEYKIIEEENMLLIKGEEKYDGKNIFLKILLQVFS